MRRSQHIFLICVKTVLFRLCLRKVQPDVWGHMSTRSLELSDLGHLVAAERNRRGFSLRQAADDIGIPFNTLARVEKGHIPDLPKFKKLVEWCGADVNQFFELQERRATTAEMIAEQLRSDRNLTSEAAERIAEIVNELYQTLARPRELAAAHLRAAATFRPDAALALAVLLEDLHDALVKEDNSGSAKRI